MSTRPTWKRLTPAEQAKVAATAMQHGISGSASRHNISTTAVRRACAMLGVLPFDSRRNLRKPKAERVERAIALLKPILRHLRLNFSDITTSHHD